MTDFDVIIVGAGPAGLSTALHLAQSAPRLAEKTVILEQAHHPRPKLCAGGVLPGGEAYLRRLGLDVSEVPSIPVRELCLQFEGSRYVIRREPVSFRTVRRDRFDGWLAGVARERGLLLWEGVRVREVQIRDGQAEVLTDQGLYCSRVVVGADGAKGLVRRSVPGRQLYQMARVLEARLAAGSKDGNRYRATLDFSWVSQGLQGYVWDFPTPSEGRAMRTWGAYDSRVYPSLSRASLKSTLEQGLARHGVPSGELELEGHPFRWFDPRAALAAPHVLLVGDAAGTDPVVGEGISFSLGYGQVAAAALRDAFERGDFSFSSYRGRVLRHRIGRYLILRSIGARLLYGLRNRYLLRTIWPLVGWLAEQVMIDWG